MAAGPHGNQTGCGWLYGYLKIVRGKSENAKRNFPITAVMHEVLLRQKKISQSDFVFVRKDRKTLLSKWTLDKQQARLRKTLHLPWDATIHSFRHSVATRLGLSGADPFTMQKLMGWSSITIAQKYVHPTPEATRAAMRRLKEFDDQMKARESRRKPVPVKVPTSKKSAAK